MWMKTAGTLAVEASRNALLMAGIEPSTIGAVYVGSESHPYAVKPTASMVAEAIGATPDLTAADLEFACKAGTAAVQDLHGHGRCEHDTLRACCWLGYVRRDALATRWNTPLPQALLLSL